MEDLHFKLGERNGDERQHVTYLRGDAKYPDSFNPNSGFERKESVKRCLRAFGMAAENVEALEAQLAQLIADATSRPDEKDRFPLVSSATLDTRARAGSLFKAK